MKRTILISVGLLTVIVSGVVHGVMTGRWDDDTDSASPRLATMSQDLGDWHGETAEVAKHSRPGINGVLHRRYTNRLTGQTVTVFLLSGRTGQVSIHTPDACYPAAGFQTIDKKKYSLNGDEFQTARMVKASQGEQTQLRIFWAWSGNGKWQAPEDARSAFPRQSNLCKMYLIHDQSKAADHLEDEACVDLMKQLVPEMKRTVFAGN